MAAPAGSPSARIIQTRNGQSMFVSNIPPESLNYDLQQSYMLSLGIDHLSTSSNSRSLTENDARHLTKSFTSTKVIPPENVKIQTTPLDYDSCTRQGIKTAFKEQANKVGREGLFVFSYRGSGVRVGSQDWSLVPTDFNEEDPCTHITAGTLTQWLLDIQSRPKYTLFILDCSFAGQVATELTSSHRKLGNIDGICVLSSCSASEALCVLNTLGHSIFTYFTALFFETTRFEPGFIPLTKICDKIQRCSTNLSSLVVTYNPTKCELKPSIISPELKGMTKQPVRITPEQMLDATDGSAIGQLEFLAKQYDRKLKPLRQLHDKALAWLETVQEFPDGPLAHLHRDDAMNKDVLLTVVCSMLFSLASIQVALEKNSISQPNLLIIAFYNIKQAVNFIQPEAEVTIDHFKSSWQFYHQVLRENKVSDKKIQKLFMKVTTVVVQSGANYTDQGSGNDPQVR